MKKNFSLVSVILPLLLAACSNVEIEKRSYPQSVEHIEKYRQRVQGKSAEQIAQNAAAEMNAKMDGKPVLVSDNLIAERVYPQGKHIVYQYRFLRKPSALIVPNMKRSMQNDLLSRTCNIQTVRLAFEGGMKEKHIYRYQLGEEIPVEFELGAGKQECQNVGLW